MAVFSKGREATAAAIAQSSGGGGKFARSIFWQDKKDLNEKVIQFITPVDEWITIGHYKVRVGTTNQGHSMMRDFVDPVSIGIEDGYNPIADRDWTAGSVRSLTKIAAVAVELVEVGSGRNKTLEIATHDYENSKGEDVTAPNVGVVIQSPKAFWSWFHSYADRKDVDMLDEGFLVERVLKSSPVKYNVVPLGDGVELDEDILGAIDLEAYLEEMASPEHYKELIDPLDDDFVLDSYGQKRGKKDDDEPKKRTSRPARSRASKALDEDPEPEADGGDGEDGDGDDAEERADAFNALKNALGKK